MSMVVGNRAVFFRMVKKKNGDGYEQRAYAGIVLDKIRGIEKIEKRLFEIDFYLVQLDGGGIERFTPEELSQALSSDKENK